MSDLLLQNINFINLDVVLKIQKDLDPYDMTSLVFLLYEIPDTALQRLIVYQKVSKDVNDDMNLLYHWVSHAQMRPTWKYEFLEALCICKQYSVIKKLGLNVSAVKEHYLPNNINFYIHINPLKKILYRLCESISSETLHTLKKTLHSFNQDITDYENCELLFLELMCKKFILDRNDSCKQTDVDFQKLAEILEHFPALSSFSVYLKELESKLNNNKNSFIKDMSKNSPLQNTAVDLNKSYVSGKCDNSDLDEFFEQLNQLNLEDIQVGLMTDKKQKCDDSYDILNPNRIGVCCIINQEEFYPSKENISKSMYVNLTTRHGSTNDQDALQRTMEALNFEVIVYKNLNSKDFMNCLKTVLKKKVLKEDSVFMLCILSHGVRGHVYAADSVKIKVEDIQCLLDSELAIKLYGKPKVLILQACQVTDEPPIQGLVADGPSSGLFLRKSDFLIYWATAPEYEAFRQESKGSLFIQFLCIIVKNKAHHEHIHDIFTKVTNTVIDVCSRVQKVQVPIFESTLRKKLFLK